LMQYISDPVVLMRRLTDMAAAAGWGILSVVGDLQYGSQLTVTAANCVFCDNQEMSTSPQCDFLVGTIKGILDRVYGAPHKVWEERCAAMGDSACQTNSEESTEELMSPDSPASRSLANARPGVATQSQRAIFDNLTDKVGGAESEIRGKIAPIAGQTAKHRPRRAA